MWFQVGTMTSQIRHKLPTWTSHESTSWVAYFNMFLQFSNLKSHCFNLPTKCYTGTCFASNGSLQTFQAMRTIRAMFFRMLEARPCPFIQILHQFFSWFYRDRIRIKSGWNLDKVFFNLDKTRINLKKNTISFFSKNEFIQILSR